MKNDKSRGDEYLTHCNATTYFPKCANELTKTLTKGEWHGLMVTISGSSAVTIPLDEKFLANFF